MKHLILQLHITGICNLRCKHCYISEHVQEMSFSDIKTVLIQFNSWAKRMRQYYKDKVMLHLHVTGGEPFLHSEIERILKYLSKCRKYRIAFMTNGTLLDKKLAKRLKHMHLKALQLSLDGTRETHDRLRGSGNYDKVINAMDLLHQYGIPCRISFTANRYNYPEFPKVAEICRNHHVVSLWSDRYIPCTDNNLLPMDESHMKEYVSILREERNNTENQKAGLRVENFRALQFIGSQDIPYYCRAGEGFLTVDEYGNIMPCRRLPVICGNIKTENLSDVYFHHETFTELRKHKINGKCRACKYAEACKGGAKCMSYAVSGDYTETDPCCFL